MRNFIILLLVVFITSACSNAPRPSPQKVPFATPLTLKEGHAYIEAIVTFENNVKDVDARFYDGETLIGNISAKPGKSDFKFAWQRPAGKMKLEVKTGAIVKDDDIRVIDTLLRPESKAIWEDVEAGKQYEYEIRWKGREHQFEVRKKRQFDSKSSRRLGCTDCPL